MSDWEDCGRPSENSNYVNSLTVFDGKLYVGTTDAKKKEDWCHVCRYDGDGKWEDCGRLGNLSTHGVGPMIVHNGELYAANWNYDYTSRRNSEFKTWDYCHVYRYQGGKEWEDCGQLGKNRRLQSMASYKGRLYVVGDGATLDPERKCYVYEGGKEWRTCGEFNDLPHCMAIHDGKLYLATSGGGMFTPMTKRNGNLLAIQTNPSPRYILWRFTGANFVWALGPKARLRR